MSSNKLSLPSPVPMLAHLSGIEVVGDLGGEHSTTRPDHFVRVYVDDEEVVKSEKKLRVPAPRWEWPEEHQFRFHPSSTIKIVLYRESRNRITKHLVGQHANKIIELLENDASIDLENKAGTRVASMIKVHLSLVSEPDVDNFESFMEAISADAARLNSLVQPRPVLLAIGPALQLTKTIMDIVSNAHPILRVSWSVLSAMYGAVYGAVQQANVMRDAIQDLSESLREMLGVAKERPDLLIIQGTTNVIEEISRTSLRVASLIHEYTQPSFIRRAFNSQLVDDIKSRIGQYQTSCNNLKQKFDRRVNMETNLQVARTEGAVNKIKDEQLAEKIYHWLSAPDSSKNYHEAREKHQPDTCSWFLDGTCFQEWQEKADFIWIKGTAGCGKSILCAKIIERIINELCKKKGSSASAYFFFDGRDSQKDLQQHEKLIRSLILQLSLQCDSTPAALVELYGHGHQQPSTATLQDTLHSIIKEFDSTYIVIDSLDECTDRERMLPWISQIVSLKIVNLHMVVASRPERDITDSLQPLDLHWVDLAGEVDQDIAIYLDQQLAPIEKWDEETRNYAKTRLAKDAQGMFRWVALQVMELKKCSNPHAVMKRLESLPRGLHETYARILLKIDETDRTDSKTILQWLCFSVRPITLEEMSEAIAVDFDVEDGPRYMPLRRYWDPWDVLEKCPGLVVESEGKIKLAHFSVKEYLMSEHLLTKSISYFRLTEELSHAFISQACLAYLLQFNTPNPMFQKSPLAPYAAEHWISHAQSGGIDESNPSSESARMLVLAQKLFTSEWVAFANWVRLWDLDEALAPYYLDMDYWARAFAWDSDLDSDSDSDSDLDKAPDTKSMQNADCTMTIIATPLYYASLAGLHRLSQHLLEKGGTINVQGGKFNSPLQAASYQGHKAVAELLLKKGANVNAQGGKYRNALQAASSEGREEIVKLLLQKGANVNAQGEHGSALQAASSKGREEIVKLLLEQGADINAKGGEYGSALYTASLKGDEAIVKLLLEKGADVNAQGGEYGSALQAALSEGKEEIVKLLLEKGADINAKGGEYGSALYTASLKGDEAIVKLLLEKGANVYALGGTYGNALNAASIEGREEIVKLLLENGADVNAHGGEYGSTLQAASIRGSVEIVKLLLEEGADVNVQGGKYGNALQAASCRGKEIVKLLLEKGANVNAQGGEYGSALQAASYWGQESIVRLLLKKGADVNAQGGEYGSALQAASHKRDDAIVELLLRGANVNAQMGKDARALQAASYKSDEAIVKLLLEKGANVNGQGGNYGSALQAASSKGHQGIIELLLANGAKKEADSIS